jgi:hypothetical protein
MAEGKLDYRKRDKELYQPGTSPAVVRVPAMNFIMVDGKGNPNQEGGEYQQAVEMLYSLSYSIKMGNKKDRPEGWTDYVVPPLEGLWWLEGETSADSDFSQKEKYFWTSMIRQPGFVTQEIFEKACRETAKKKPGLDVSKARLEALDEGMCLQVMHIGPYDEEPMTIALMEAFLMESGYRNAIGDSNPDGSIRRHHEIYLGDPRKTEPSKMKTILRHPIK